ncbi:MAG: response regulator [Nitrospirae bacterium]|nr:response regulator [Nitrospirota bacterium]
MHKIMVVDDDDSIRKLMIELLKIKFRDPQVKIIEAANGEEAAQAFSNDVDLVITDYMMPKMDGLKLAAWLRDNAPQTRIILATGSLFGHEIPANVNIDDFIMKPFGPKDFLSCVSKLLENKRGE